MNIIFLLIPLLPACAIRSRRNQVSWVEEYYGDKDDRNDMEIFFDRTVFLSLNREYPIAPGVFITNDTILTSYNPFRVLQRQKKPLDWLKVIVLLKRRFNPAGVDNVHVKDFVNISCARQVVPIPENNLTSKEWHGTTKQHSPLHDLMVVRLIKNKLKFLDPDPKYYSFDNYTKEENSSYIDAGPMTTRLAAPDDIIDRGFMFASLGFKSKEHIEEGLVLSSKRYTFHELTDCDEYMPREWGHFICVRNSDRFQGVGSGALLVCRDKIFGIGSFVYERGNSSILVFTDVRPYISVIFKTCSKKSDKKP